MMYGDEENIASLIEADNAVQDIPLIEQKLTIYGEEIDFCYFEWLSFFSIVIPAHLGEMLSEDARKKYPSEDRPSKCYSNTDWTVSVAFEVYQEGKQNLEERLKLFPAVIRRLYPSNKIFNEEIITGEHTEVGYFDYRSPAWDMDLYNLTFFADLGSFEVMGWFNCPYELWEEWEPVIKEIIKTIQPLEPDEE